MILPTSPRLSILDPEGFKWLIMSEQGVGKSSLLMSIQKHLDSSGKPPILIIDPESNIALSGFVVSITKWQDDLEALKALIKPDRPIYSWIGIDNLNMHYDMSYTEFMKKSPFDYPPEDFGATWSRITTQFVTWLRGIINIGIPIIATCHLNMVELKIKKDPFNRYIPAFRGSSATSAYKQVLQSFDILGFMTFETKSVEAPKDLRKDLPSSVLAKDPEMAEVRVIHFQPSQYWDAQVPLSLLPAKVTLPSNWEEDWITILENWRKTT